MESLKACFQAAEIASAMAVIVDAKHEQAKSFYEHYGFTVFPDKELTLFMPIKQVRALVKPLIF